MTGRGDAAPATTPQGRESPARQLPYATKRTNRRPRFEGIEWIFGNAVEPPSDVAGILVSCGRARRQIRSSAPYPATGCVANEGDCARIEWAKTGQTLWSTQLCLRPR